MLSFGSDWGSESEHRGKIISAFINDWENIITYGKNPSKAGPWLLANAILLYCK